MTSVELQFCLATACVVVVLVLFAFVIGFYVGRRVGLLEFDRATAMDVIERVSTRNLSNPPPDSTDSVTDSAEN